MRRVCYSVCSWALASLLLSGLPATATESITEEADSLSFPKHGHHGPRVVVSLLASTQNNPWPPSEVVDANGDFIVVGQILRRDTDGSTYQESGAAIVSKNTVPPLDAAGKEDFSDLFAGAYDVIRELDLSPGSPDLEIELHTSSFGPAVGDFGGGPRIPSDRDSRYNLNPLPPTCPEIFPASSQERSYRLPGFPLIKAPIWGFRGDDVSYDIETGDEFVPRLGSGPDCFPAGCLGEDEVDQRRIEPITLGDWLAHRGRVRITLTNYDPRAGGFTSALFEFRFSGLVPNGLYTLWGIRSPNLAGLPAGPLGFPNVLVADEQGRGRAEIQLENPFPSGYGAHAASRVLGIGVSYHPDFQVWGACFGRLGPGVDISGVLSSLSAGEGQLTPFVTVEPVQNP